LRRLAQTISWILLLGIAALSFVPPTLRPITCLPHIVEHAALYFITGCAFGLSYSNRFFTWLAGLSTFTLAIEIAQLWIPGRHARGLDFLVDIFSICAGLGIGVKLAPRSRVRSQPPLTVPRASSPRSAACDGGLRVVGISKLERSVLCLCRLTSRSPFCPVACLIKSSKK